MPDISKLPEKQLIDYYLVDEIEKIREYNFARMIQGKIRETHGIIIPTNKIYARARAAEKEVTLTPAADIDGQPSIRTGKDQNYAGFWTLVDILIPKEERVYCGLSSNQIDTVRQHIGSLMVVCEWNAKKYQKLNALAEFLSQKKAKPEIQIEKKNIFDVLQENPNTFNVIDLDLMCTMRAAADQSYWIEALSRGTKQGWSIVNITTTLGRSITAAQYQENIEAFIHQFNHTSALICRHSQFGYLDRKTPMRADRMIIYKRKEVK